MLKKIEGQIHYSTSEVAEVAGVHRLTLLRWIKEGKVKEVGRDRNNWRIFSQAELDGIRSYSATGVYPDRLQRELPLFKEGRV